MRLKKLGKSLRITLRTLVIGVIFCSTASVVAQDGSVTLPSREISVRQSINELQRQTGYNVIVDAAVLNLDKMVILSGTQLSTRALLAQLLSGTYATYTVAGNDIIVVGMGGNMFESGATSASNNTSSNATLTQQATSTGFNEVVPAHQSYDTNGYNPVYAQSQSEYLPVYTDQQPQGQQPNANSAPQSQSPMGQAYGITSTAPTVASSVLSSMDGVNAWGVMFNFRVNKTDLESEYMSNQAMFALLHSILGNTDMMRSIDYVTITASASPEGNTNKNMRLAQGRANALKTYLKGRGIPVTTDRIVTYPIGEDWDGLRKMVEEDLLTPSRESVLRILDSWSYSSDQKRTALSKLPTAYSYIKKNMLPYLRGVGACVIYFKQNASDAETPRYMIDQREGVRRLVAANTPGVNTGVGVKPLTNPGSVQAYGNNFNGSTTISWNPVPGAVGYYYQIGNENTPPVYTQTNSISVQRNADGSMPNVRVQAIAPDQLGVANSGYTPWIATRGSSLQSTQVTQGTQSPQYGTTSYGTTNAYGSMTYPSYNTGYNNYTGSGSYTQSTPPSNTTMVRWNPVAGAEVYAYQVGTDNKTYYTSTPYANVERNADGSVPQVRVQPVATSGSNVSSSPYTTSWTSVSSNELQPPSNIRTSGATQTSETVSWDPVNGAKGYYVQVGNDPRPMYVNTPYVSVPKNADGTTPRISIQAVPNDGSSLRPSFATYQGGSNMPATGTQSYTSGTYVSGQGMGNNMGVTAGTGYQPGSYMGQGGRTNMLPTPTGVTPQSIDAQRSQVTWNAVPGAKGYNIQVGNENTTPLYTTNPSYVVPKNADGTTPPVRIQAIPNDGSVQPSSYTAWTGAGTNMLPTPSNVGTRSSTPTTSIAEWAPVQGAKGYYVQVGNDNAQPLYTQTPSMVVQKNADGTTPRVRVQAVPADGTTQLSNYSAWTSMGTNILPTPKGVTPQTIDAQRSQVIWEAVPGASGYYVQVGDENSEPFYTNEPKADVYNVDGRTPNVRIKAVAPYNAGVEDSQYTPWVSPYTSLENINYANMSGGSRVDTIIIRDTVYLDNNGRHISAYQYEELDSTYKRRYYALKTNLLSDVLLLPDLHFEMSLGHRWSLSLGGQWAWWFLQSGGTTDGSTRYIYRLQAATLEARKWFGSSERHNTLNGFYLGVYGTYGTFDVHLHSLTGNIGYLSNGIWSVGLSGGYSMPLNRNLNLDFGIAVGYVRADYQGYLWNPEFNCFHHYPAADGRINGIYPTRAQVSLVWLIGSGKNITRPKNE